MSRITFISRMTVKPSHVADYIAVCRELEAYVQANEPDTLWFGFFRLREPNRYAVVESFPNEAAEHLHMTSKKLAELAPRITACLDGTWEREYLDPLS
jgi:autoinducer 2-degrading protein